MVKNNGRVDYNLKMDRSAGRSEKMIAIIEGVSEDRVSVDIEKWSTDRWPEGTRQKETGEHSTI